MADESKAPGRAHRAGRAFVREFLIPVGLALIFIQFAVQAFKIPSASMERSLLIGDFLLGLKFIYGSPIPFTHKRLPALTEPRPGDVLIFRYPGDPAYPEGNPDRYRFVANLFLFGNVYWDRAPEPGEKSLVWYAPKDFIKRAVAKSGQTIEVEGTSVRVDGRALPLPREGLYSEGTGSLRPFSPVRDRLRFRLPAPGETIAFDTLSLTQATWIRSLALQENPGRRVELKLDLWRGNAVDNDYVIPSIEGLCRAVGTTLLMEPHLQLLQLDQGVSIDERGICALEKVSFRRVQEAAAKGFVSLRRGYRYDPYRRVGYAERLAAPGRRNEYNDYYFGAYLETVMENIMRHDPAARVRARLVIDGAESGSYTVRDESYFMMGDNRDNSSDSRYWGPLSRGNVKAKALIIYYSFENEDRTFAFGNPLSWFTVPLKIRWTRLGRIID
jgi:signal peptidase I